MACQSFHVLFKAKNWLKGVEIMKNQIAGQSYLELHLHKMFSNPWHLHVIFTRTLFSSLLPWEFVHDTIHNCNFKVWLCGEISKMKYDVTCIYWPIHLYKEHFPSQEQLGRCNHILVQ